MQRRAVARGAIPAVLGLVLLGASLRGQSLVEELRAVRDPARRSEKALTLADEAFDDARGFYDKGEIKKGDAQLDNMTQALRECAESLAAMHHGGGHYKKAELRVAALQRRLQGLLEDIDAQDRGWADYTARKVDEIHDQLLAGVMRK
ncbi:MAG TPA: hypothetical protein VHZ07_07960 [Bryobacteraceae bacterium]|jgi:hypothetical protein|nr:hypothetical protein [Bryobacteraceae bacterium]